MSHKKHFLYKEGHPDVIYLFFLHNRGMSHLTYICYFFTTYIYKKIKEWYKKITFCCFYYTSNRWYYLVFFANKRSFALYFSLICCTINLRKYLHTKKKDSLALWSDREAISRCLFKSIELFLRLIF